MNYGYKIFMISNFMMSLQSGNKNFICALRKKCIIFFIHMRDSISDDHNYFIYNI